VFVDSINEIGVFESAMIASVLLVGAAVLIVKRPPGSAVLAAGFVIRFALAVVEFAAHTSQLFPSRWPKVEGVSLFLASYSSLDTAAEWIIALGCVLTLYRSIQLELQHANDDLRAAQKVLQDLVDRDMLTTLPNRRALPAALRAAFNSGATVLFFDLDDFKRINDSYGHQAGDECLRRFAQALQASFRPEDHVIRYAGDEFVVLALGATPEQVMPHIEGLRERLRFERAAFEIEFSVGHAYVPPGGDGEEALRAADAGMYRAKNGESSHVRRR
jgi:diguanylate cyclase (GGDEF)-like protein